MGHQRIAGEIYVQLARLVGFRRAVIAPADVPVDEYNVFQPDVVVVNTPLPDDATDSDSWPDQEGRY